MSLIESLRSYDDECHHTPPSKHHSFHTRILTTSTVNSLTDYQCSDPFKCITIEIPEYLKRIDASLQNTIEDLEKMYNLWMNCEDIHAIAFCIHTIRATNLEKQVWNVYLRMGRAQWKPRNNQDQMICESYWPSCVRARATIESKTNEQIIEEQLNEFDRIIEHYELKLKEKKHSLVFMNDTIERMIGDYVENHGIQSVRLKCNYRLNMLDYDFECEIIDRQFRRLEPNENQVNRFLFDIKYTVI